MRLTASIVITWISLKNASSYEMRYNAFLEPSMKTKFEKRVLLNKSKLKRRTAGGDDSCDYAFINCLSDESCVNCFTELDDNGVNWAGVTVDTTCSDVLSLLHGNGHCTVIKEESNNIDVFCNTYNSCGVWNNDDLVDDSSMIDDYSEDGEQDCSSLKSCSWNGIHEGFVGDGICHDFGCYNTEICGYDGGDCCADTCVSNGYSECGDDHFYCRDPSSIDCNGELEINCQSKNSTNPNKKPFPSCIDNKYIYKLVQHDSFGDGWDYTTMRISSEPGDDEVYSGSLKSGFTDFEYVCLPNGCYNVDLAGGVWGSEVSWEIMKRNQGNTIVANGFAPMNCKFPVGGDYCTKTCNDNYEAGYDDDTWQTYDSLSSCLSKSCVIQLNVCEGDNACKPCLIDDSPSFCYTNDNYNALVDCALCNCVEDTPSFCYKGNDENDSFSQCTAQQTLSGANSIFYFSKCSNIDSVEAMSSDWDEDNFGALDRFEACAHSFSDDVGHSGNTALGCMRILSDILEPDSKETPVVKAMANDLYKSGESFCDCTSDSSKKCPPCKDFLHFKTLLYESMDACASLDEIDCAAWSEFHEPCKKKMMSEFGSVNFKQNKQCNFIQQGCDNTGPFPAFRRLDCGKEISKSAWDFYISYQRGCTGNNTPTSTTSPTSKKNDKPVKSPTLPPKPVGPPTKPYGPPSNGPKPYNPSNDTPTPYSSSSSSKRHPVMWFFLISFAGAIGFFVYKQRLARTSFDFVQYSRQRNYAQFDGDMGNSLTDATSSWSFEPPSLPPPPTPNHNNTGSYVPVQT